MFQIERLKIAIIGLGYVGLPLAVEFGKHVSTVGFDINTTRINELKNGFDHTLEVTQQELQKQTLLSYTSDIAQLDQSNFYNVTVPTRRSSSPGSGQGRGKGSAREGCRVRLRLCGGASGRSII